MGWAWKPISAFKAQFKNLSFQVIQLTGFDIGTADKVLDAAEVAEKQAFSATSGAVTGAVSRR